MRSMLLAGFVALTAIAAVTPAHAQATGGMIVAQTLTNQDARRSVPGGAPLLDQIDKPIGQVTADGAYDGSST